MPTTGVSDLVGDAELLCYNAPTFGGADRVTGAIAQFSGNEQARIISEYFQPGTWLYYVLSAILIIFFTYFYTSIIFNPVDISENLKKQGGFIPGVKPGATAQRLLRTGWRPVRPAAGR